MPCGSSIRQDGSVESLHFTPMEPVVSGKHLAQGGSQVLGMPPVLPSAVHGSGNALIGAIQ